MFTIEQIHTASKKAKSGADFPQLVQDLKAIGVHYYDNYVKDGLTKYYGKDKFVLNAGTKYPAITVKPNSSADKLKHAISIHQLGQTDYPTFCMQAAEAGVEKWTTDMLEMTVTYLDIKGHKLIVEPIPQPKTE
jgi:uncharacterized protein YbcV (DUF1398 family)